MWLEIRKTLMRVEALLAKSRAYHAVEVHLRHDSKNADHAWPVHLDKMNHFNLAAVLLAKIGDLVLRLIFERMGASLVPSVDQNDPEWERALTWKNVRKGFKDRTGNRNVAVLGKEEHERIQELLDEFPKPDFVGRIRLYRHNFIHRIVPSVDHSELYVRLQDRQGTPIMNESGNIKGWMKTLRGPPPAEYLFSGLYGDAVQTLNHFVALLERLQAIPRFSPEAI